MGILSIFFGTIKSTLGSLFSNVWVVLGCIIFTIVISTILYIRHLSSEVDALTLQNQQLITTVTALQNEVKAIRSQHEQVIQDNKELLNKVVALQQSLTKQEETLYREKQKKKSLEQIALKKTSLVQKLVNNATDNVLKCFEVLSGAKNEKNLNCDPIK